VENFMAYEGLGRGVDAVVVKVAKVCACESVQRCTRADSVETPVRVSVEGVFWLETATRIGNSRMWSAEEVSSRFYRTWCSWSRVYPSLALA